MRQFAETTCTVAAPAPYQMGPVICTTIVFIVAILAFTGAIVHYNTRTT